MSEILGIEGRDLARSSTWSRVRVEWSALRGGWGLTPAPAYHLLTARPPRLQHASGSLCSPFFL